MGYNLIYVHDMEVSAQDLFYFDLRELRKQYKPLEISYRAYTDEVKDAAYVLKARTQKGADEYYAQCNYRELMEKADGGMNTALDEGTILIVAHHGARNSLDSGRFLPAGILKQKGGAGSNVPKKETERINPTAYATAIFNKFAQRAKITKVVYCVCHSGTNLSATDLFDQVAPLNALAEGSRNGDDHNNYYVYRDMLELHEAPGNGALTLETKKLNKATGKATPLRKQSPFRFSLSQLLGFTKESITQIPDLVYVPSGTSHNWPYIPARSIPLATLKDLVIFYSKKKTEDKPRPTSISAALSGQKSDTLRALRNLLEGIREKDEEPQMLKAAEGIMKLTVAAQPVMMSSGKPDGKLLPGKMLGTMKDKTVLQKPATKVLQSAPSSNAKQLKTVPGPPRQKAVIPKPRPIPQVELVMDPDFFGDPIFMELLYRNCSLPYNKQAEEKNNPLLIMEDVGAVAVIRLKAEVKKEAYTHPKHLDDIAIRPQRAKDGTVKRAKSAEPQRLPAIVPPVEQQKQDIKIENRKIITV